MTSILAAFIPAQTSTPTVEQVSALSTFVRIDWNPPNARGSTIIEYEIQFLSSDGGFYTLPYVCNGTDPNLILETSCNFDMLEVTTSPLLLVQGDLIVV